MVSIRLANYDDFEFYLQIKSEDNNIFWTGHDKKPDRTAIQKFFYSTIEDKNKNARKIYIVEVNNERCGYLYLIPDGDCFDLASSISEKFQGRGFGKKAIALGLEEGRKLGYKKMVGSIREDNIASLKAYSSLNVRVTQDYKMVFIPKLGKEVKMFTVEKILD